jgi:Brp/Blh family beta-carotene 15,15'-monooxygenase
MNFKELKHSNILTLSATLAFIVCGVFGLFDSSVTEVIVAAILIVTVGLPHGATDLLLVKYLSTDRYKQSVGQTLFQYIGLIALYGSIWYFIPQLAFILFIAISIYHFGQSNYNFIQVESRVIRTLSYLASGSFVLLTPLCIHYEIAVPIIETISGTTAYSISATTAETLPRALFLTNVWLLVFLFLNDWITSETLVYQLVSIVLLLLCYWFLPLILGFTIYFVFWHSLHSMVDQVDYIRTKENDFTWLRYYKNALPITLLAVILIAAGYWINITWSINFSIIEVFFIMLSLMTLPHIILIEQLYSNFRQVDTLTVRQLVND